MLLSGLIGHLEFDFFIRPVINCSCFLSASLSRPPLLCHTHMHTHTGAYGHCLCVCLYACSVRPRQVFVFAPHTTHTHTGVRMRTCSAWCAVHVCVCVSLYVCNCHHAASYCNFCCCFANFLDSLNLPTHTHTQR